MGFADSVILLPNDLTSGDCGRQVRAAWFIADTQCDAELPSLVSSLKTVHDPEARYWIILALGRIATDHARDELRKLRREATSDGDMRAIKDALNCLGLGDC
jgi:hypothetical protein